MRSRERRGGPDGLRGAARRTCARLRPGARRARGRHPADGAAAVAARPARRGRGAGHLARRLAAQFAPEDLQLLYQIAIMARRDLDFAPDARGGFEMALLRMLAFRPEQAGSVPAAPWRVAAVALPRPAARACRSRAAPPGRRQQAPRARSRLPRQRRDRGRRLAGDRGADGTHRPDGPARRALHARRPQGRHGPADARPGRRGFPRPRSSSG